MHCAAPTQAFKAKTSEPPLLDEAPTPPPYSQRSALRRPTQPLRRVTNLCMSCDATFRPPAPIQCTVPSRLDRSTRHPGFTPPEARFAPCSRARRSSWKPGRTPPCRGSYTVRGIAVGSAVPAWTGRMMVGCEEVVHFQATARLHRGVTM